MSALHDGPLAAKMLTDRLGKNRRHLGRWAQREGVTCWRHYDRDIPDVPVTIDEYEGALVVADCRRCGKDEVLDPAWLETVLDAIAAATPGAEIFTRTRRRMSHHGGPDTQYQRHDDTGAWREVGEAGRRFHVNLSDYLDTGLFLDHRIMRRNVRAESSGRHMLNLFAYTGAFSVHAAAGGAKTTTSIDLSQTYLDWARDNLAANHFGEDRHQLVRADIVQWLEAPSSQRWDLAVVDPPTFSNSKKMRGVFDVQRDHPMLLRRVFERMNRGGVVYFSTNARRFKLAPEAFEGCAKVDDISRATLPADFRDEKIHRAWRVELA